jgi:hypothetical protein
MDLLHDVVDEQLVAGQLGEAKREVELVHADDEGDPDREALHDAERNELRALIELEDEAADADESGKNSQQGQNLLAVPHGCFGEDAGQGP